MQLHIGGTEVKEGWKILNALPLQGVDFVGDARDLGAFGDGSCSKVYASHVMEHIEIKSFHNVMKEIYRILSDDGAFYISVPDLEVLCKLFLSEGLNAEQRFHVMKMMFGGQVDEYDFHKIGLTHEIMIEYFRAAGFSTVERVESFGLFNDASEFRPYGVPISLNLIVYK
jgi:predicted SAM-dependent methyltransferase